MERKEYIRLDWAVYTGEYCYAQKNKTGSVECRPQGPKLVALHISLSKQGRVLIQNTSMNLHAYSMEQSPS
jgi:hypothetical protein